MLVCRARIVGATWPSAFLGDRDRVVPTLVVEVERAQVDGGFGEIGRVCQRVLVLLLGALLVAEFSSVTPM